MSVAMRRPAPSPWQGEGWGRGRMHHPLTRTTPTPASALQAVPGFEATDYAWLDGRIVWAGGASGSDHPRNLTRPWQPTPQAFNARALADGARALLSQLDASNCHGLLRWLMAGPLPFPLELARPRLDAVRDALARQHAPDFEAAALRLLGLGPGLTPSGDDFIGAVFFALEHAPRAAWREAMPAMKLRVHHAAQTATNAISAALLGDLMAGASYRALHELLAALQDGEPAHINHTTQALLRLGANSGADMLAGLLLTLITST
jgi:Protein of unknown function (DUF2877)